MGGTELQDGFESSSLDPEPKDFRCLSPLPALRPNHLLLCTHLVGQASSLQSLGLHGNRLIQAPEALKKPLGSLPEYDAACQLHDWNLAWGAGR